MNPFGQIASFFSGPQTDQVDAYKETKQWVAEFRSTESQQAVHDLVLDQARRTYATRQRVYELMDSKSLELLRLSGILTTVLVAFVGAMDLALTWPVLGAVICFLVSIAICVRCRSPKFRCGETTARSILEGTEDYKFDSAAAADVWLAASLHGSSEGLRVAVDWKADRVQEATWALVAGILVLALALLVGL